MAIRLSSAPRISGAALWRCGLGAGLLAAGLAMPGQAAGGAPGLACTLGSPIADAAAQRVAQRRRSSQVTPQTTPMLHAFFICPELPGRPVGVGWRTSGPLRHT